MRDEIVFRRAEVRDLPDVCRLIEAELQADKGFSAHKRACLLANLNQDLKRIFVYIYQKRIIGVICGNFIRGKEKIDWMAVNPVFPEGTVCSAMVFTLLGVYSRNPVTYKEFKRIWKVLLKTNDRNFVPEYYQQWNEGASFGFSVE